MSTDAVMRNLSFVIPSCGRDSLQDCLQSIRIILPLSEIVVVGPQKVQPVVEQFQGIFVKEPDSFTSISTIFNLGFRNVSLYREYVCWCNDDSQLLKFPKDFEPEPDIIYALGVTNDIAKDKPEYWRKTHLVPYCDFGLFHKKWGQRFGWWSEQYKFYAADSEFVLKFWLHADGMQHLEGSLVYHSPHEDEHKNKIKKLLSDDLKMYYDKWNPVKDKLKQEVAKKQRCLRR